MKRDQNDAGYSILDAKHISCPMLNGQIIWQLVTTISIEHPASSISNLPLDT